MEAAKPDYMWLVDEWMECAESLARECNKLRDLLTQHQARLVELETEIAAYKNESH